jgi:ABC-type antimicrobial peptide transport system permease subunit
MTVGVALLVSGIMGLVGGFLPALSAARMQPVQAMRE